MIYFSVSAKGRKGYYFESRGYVYECDMDGVGEFQIHADNRQAAIRKCKVIAQSNNPQHEISKQEVIQQIHIMDIKIKNNELTQEQAMNVNKQMNALIEKYSLDMEKREEEREAVTQPINTNKLEENTTEKQSMDARTYTAFNRSFSSYDEAYNFCTSCDFDLSIIQQEGLTTVLTMDLQYFSSSTEHVTEEDKISTDKQEVPSILYFNTYSPEQLTHTQWQQDISKHTAKYYELSNNEILSHDELQSLIDNNYRFWVKTINTNPYYHKDSYLIELFLSYINKPITLYINKSIYDLKLNNN